MGRYWKRNVVSGNDVVAVQAGYVGDRKHSETTPETPDEPTGTSINIRSGDAQVGVQAGVIVASSTCVCNRQPSQLGGSCTHHQVKEASTVFSTALASSCTSKTRGDPTQMLHEYTHPDVLTIGVRDGWADPETDPTRIDWDELLKRAAIPFEIVNGRPVNPCERTGIRYGRNDMGHWAEALAVDALVTANDQPGHRWIVMIERSDGHGWALPGGHVDPGETPADAAVRELAEETGLKIPNARWKTHQPRYVPDPRASDEAWIVTVLSSTHIGTFDRDQLPALVGADDSTQAAWVLADTYDVLDYALAAKHGGHVFAAHRDLLADALS